MSPPMRRATDSEDGSMERSFTLLREEMRAGFDGMFHRLDTLNGRVNTHGEAIATLKQGCLSNAQLASEVHALAQEFASHRARCPYDGSGDAASMAAANVRWTNAQLAGGVAGGSAAGFILLEIIQWFVQAHLGR